MNTASVLREEDVMTDYQFKSIIKMAVSIVKDARDKESAIKELERILPESERDGN